MRKIRDTHLGRERGGTQTATYPIQTLPVKRGVPVTQGPFFCRTSTRGKTVTGQPPSRAGGRHDEPINRSAQSQKIESPRAHFFPLPPPDRQKVVDQSALKIELRPRSNHRSATWSSRLVYQGAILPAVGVRMQVSAEHLLPTEATAVSGGLIRRE